MGKPDVGVTRFELLTTSRHSRFARDDTMTSTVNIQWCKGTQ